jgi:hypothetical protein
MHHFQLCEISLSSLSLASFSLVILTVLFLTSLPRSLSPSSLSGSFFRSIYLFLFFVRALSLGETQAHTTHRSKWRIITLTFKSTLTCKLALSSTFPSDCINTLQPYTFFQPLHFPSMCTCMWKNSAEIHNIRTWSVHKAYFTPTSTQPRRENRLLSRSCRLPSTELLPLVLVLFACLGTAFAQNLFSMVSLSSEYETCLDEAWVKSICI